MSVGVCTICLDNSCFFFVVYLYVYPTVRICEMGCRIFYM